MSAVIDPWLLSKLVCPSTRTPLRQLGPWLVSESAGLAYPIRKGVPVLLAEEGRPVSEAIGDQTI